MGDLISLLAINRKPSLLEKVVSVVFAGIPFRGEIGYMKDFHVGNPTGFNSRIQGACMIVKYETVFGFFPRLLTWDSMQLLVSLKKYHLKLNFTFF